MSKTLDKHLQYRSARGDCEIVRIPTGTLRAIQTEHDRAACERLGIDYDAEGETWIDRIVSEHEKAGDIEPLDVEAFRKRYAKALLQRGQDLQAGCVTTPGKAAFAAFTEACLQFSAPAPELKPVDIEPLDVEEILRAYRAELLKYHGVGELSDANARCLRRAISRVSAPAEQKPPLDVDEVIGKIRDEAHAQNRPEIAQQQLGSASCALYRILHKVLSGFSAPAPELKPVDIEPTRDEALKAIDLIDTDDSDGTVYDTAIDTIRRYLEAQGENT